MAQNKSIQYAVSAQLTAARARGNAAMAKPSWPTAARYDKKDDAIVIELRSGFAVVVPRGRIKELENATPAQLEKVELWGDGLHWESLDVDVGVPALLGRALGQNALSGEIGRRGGSTRSEVKAAAARANGAKAGRPRKAPKK
jgi:hypothetical protein